MSTNDAEVEVKDCPEAYKETIHKCLKKSEAGNYVFRGTSKRYFEKDGDRVTSTLYRELSKTGLDLEKFEFYALERDILDRARQFFKAGAGDIEILTELRHFGQELALIDFTKNIYVALFFACYDDPEHDGELILYQKPCTVDVVRYDEIGSVKNEPIVAIEPTQAEKSANRVCAQHSVFIRTPAGCIPKNEDEISLLHERIPKEHKKDILDHLQSSHGINFLRVYSDIFGFINSRTTQAMAQKACADAEYNCKHRDAAIMFLEKSISQDPQYYQALYNLAVIYWEKGDSEKEEEYLSKAIASHPRPEDAQFNYGTMLFERGKELHDAGDTKQGEVELKKAISRFDQVISCNPSKAEAYNNRGYAQSLLGRHPEAIDDLTRSIEIDGNKFSAFINRGMARARMGQSQEEKNQIQDNEKHIELYLEASADFDAAAQAEPNSHIAIYNKGLVLGKIAEHHKIQGRLEQAVDYNGQARVAFELAIKRLEKKEGDPSKTELAKVNASLALSYEITAGYHVRTAAKDLGIKLFEMSIEKYDFAVNLYRELEKPEVYLFASTLMNRGFAKMSLASVYRLYKPGDKSNTKKYFDASERDFTEAIDQFESIDVLPLRILDVYRFRGDVRHALSELCSPADRDKFEKYQRSAAEDRNRFAELQKKFTESK